MVSADPARPSRPGAGRPGAIHVEPQQRLGVGPADARNIVTLSTATRRRSNPAAAASHRRKCGATRTRAWQSAGIVGAKTIGTRPLPTSSIDGPIPGDSRFPR
ncbi:hypothetical protein AA13595_2100 [Gluconacetobacter johannae DSM 13595]|nr:hypothetical protein AA13595_2100 [Gluconacetobacter johannae DSM 13595]